MDKKKSRLAWYTNHVSPGILLDRRDSELDISILPLKLTSIDITPSEFLNCWNFYVPKDFVKMSATCIVVLTTGDSLVVIRRCHLRARNI